MVNSIFLLPHDRKMEYKGFIEKNLYMEAIMTAPVNNLGRTQALMDFCQSSAKLYHAIIPDIGKIVVAKIDKNIETLPENRQQIAKKVYNVCFFATQSYFAYYSLSSYTTGFLCGLACRILPKIVPIQITLPRVTNSNEMKTEYCLFIAVSSVFFSTIVGGVASGFVAGNYIPELLADEPIFTLETPVEPIPTPVAPPPPVIITLRDRIRSVPGQIFRVPSNLSKFIFRRNT